MSVDELIDDPDMDRALRALQPQMSRSRSWERARRGELLAFIETGQVARPAPLHRFQPDDIVVSDTMGGRRDSRRLTWVASAAAVAVLVAGLVVVSVWRDAEPNEPGIVDQPTSTPVPSTTELIGVGVVDSSLRPELYPAFAVGDPRNDNAWGSYSQVGYENAQWVQALVARPDADVFVDAVGIMVWADVGDVDVTALGTHTTQTLANGSTVDVYTEHGTPPTITVLLPNDPVAVTGTNPLPFVDAIVDLSGVEPVASRADDGNTVVDFNMAELGSLEPLHVLVPLPPGYVTIVEPHPLARGSLNATLVSGNEAENDFIAVEVGLINPLNGWSVVGPLRPSDVNGTTAWIREQTTRSSVSWQIGERTWVTVTGAPTTDAALEAARSVEFVDEATWQDRYGIEEPTFAAPPGDERDEDARIPSTADEFVSPAQSVEPSDTLVAADTTSTTSAGIVEVTDDGFTPPARDVRLLVANASNVNGAASALSVALAQHYETRPAVNTASSVGQVARTIVYYRPGFKPDANLLADDLGGADVLQAPATLPIESPTDDALEPIDILIMLGNDHARRTPTE